MMMAMMSIPTLFSRSNSTISRFSLSMPMSRAVLMMMMSTVNSQQSHLPRGSTQSMLMEFPCSSNILLIERSLLILIWSQSPHLTQKMGNPPTWCWRHPPSPRRGGTSSQGRWVASVLPSSWGAGRPGPSEGENSQRIVCIDYYSNALKITNMRVICI